MRASHAGAAVLALWACACLAQAPHGPRGLSLVGRFVYSESYRDAAADECTTEADEDGGCYQQAQLLAAADSGKYTRQVFDLVVNGAHQADAVAGTPRVVDQLFRYVASQGSGGSDGDYAEYAAQCPRAAPCQGITEAYVELVISDVRVAYPLRRICFSQSGNHHRSSSYGRCMLPQAYLPLTGLATCDSQGSFPAACAGTEGAPSCLLPQSCREQPCDSTAFPLTQAQVDSMLDAKNGVERDPSTGFLDMLNTRCVEACCSACPAEGVSADSASQVWALGPATFAFQVLAPRKLLVSGTATVTNMDTGAVRTVQLEDLDVGSVALDASGAREVRSTVMAVSAEMYSSLPDLTSGAVLVSDYSATPTGFVRMSADPAVNGYSLLPNEGRGLAPTQRNLALGFSLAYLNQTSLLGSGLGHYGVSQAALTSDRSEFTNPASCYDDYFSSYKNVPGWQLDSSTADVPLVPTMDRMTAQLNRATDQFLSGTVPPDEIVGTSYLMPGESLEKPRFSIFDDTLYYFVPDGDLLTLLGQAREDPAHNVQASPGWAVLRDIRQRAENVVTLALDISTDFLPYNGISASASVADGSGCEYSWTNGTGNVAVTVENLSTVSANDYTVEIACDTGDNTILTVASLAPSTFSLPSVGPGSVKQTQPPAALALVNGTAAASAAAPPVVYCNVQVFDDSSSQLPLTQGILTCLRIPDSPAQLQAANGGTVYSRPENCTRSSDGTVHCETNTDNADYTWEAVAVVVGACLLLLLLGVIACAVLVCCLCRKKTDDKAEYQAAAGQ